jgi:hypothetical protein
VTVFFTKEFIRDLAEHPDPNFAGKVMAKVANADGLFEPAVDDHRYKGIEGAFIRYISQRPHYYRAIYIRRGADVYWYRAGRHSVEDRLQAPAEPLGGVAIGPAPDGLDLLQAHRHPRYTKSTRPRYLREVIAARSLIPHRNLILVSPRLTATIIAPTGAVGRLTDRAQEFGASVTVITRPPHDRDLNAHRWLASRGVDLKFHDRLSARLYYFEVDEEQLDPELKNVRSIAIVGSAELTERGLNQQLPEGQEADEELCYEVEEEDVEGAMEFCLELTDGTVDFGTYIAMRHA